MGLTDICICGRKIYRKSCFDWWRHETWVAGIDWKMHGSKGREEIAMSKVLPREGRPDKLHGQCQGWLVLHPRSCRKRV
jgi:hypothetical protein